MELTREQVLHIAKLARIALSGEEVERYRYQLSSILEHFAILGEVPTENVEPTAYPLPLENVFRADEVSPSLPKELVLANAPEVEDGMFRVRAVLE